MRGDRGDLAGVVGLVAADRDQRVRALGERVGDEVLELAGLVAAVGEPGVAVLALGPDLRPRRGGRSAAAAGGPGWGRRSAGGAGSRRGPCGQYRGPRPEQPLAPGHRDRREHGERDAGRCWWSGRRCSCASTNVASGWLTSRQKMTTRLARAAPSPTAGSAAGTAAGSPAGRAARRSAGRSHRPAGPRPAARSAAESRNARPTTRSLSTGCRK